MSEKKGFFGRLKSGLSKTRDSFVFLKSTMIFTKNWKNNSLWPISEWKRRHELSRIFRKR